MICCGVRGKTFGGNFIKYSCNLCCRTTLTVRVGKQQCIVQSQIWLLAVFLYQDPYTVSNMSIVAFQNQPSQLLICRGNVEVSYEGLITDMLGNEGGLPMSVALSLKVY